MSRPEDFTRPVVCAPTVVFGQAALLVSDAGASCKITLFGSNAIVVPIAKSSKMDEFDSLFSLNRLASEDHFLFALCT